MKPAQIAVPLLCLVVGGVIGYGIGGGMGSPSEASGPDAAAALETATAENEHLTEKLDDAQNRFRSAERDLASVRRELATTLAANTASNTAAAAPADALETAPVDPTDPADTTAESGDWRVRVENYPLVRVANEDAVVDEALQDIEWTSVAEHMSAMVPLLEQVVESLGSGTPLSGETQAGIQVHNGHLVVAAVKLMNKKVPGTGANGSFTHPAVMANMIAGNLEALGMPLDKRQNELLAKAARDFTRRDTTRLAAYTDETLQIRRLLEESLLKGEFFDEAFRILSTEQHDALRPEPTRGRCSVDLHSQGLVWAGRVAGVDFRDRDHLTQLVEARIVSSMPEESRGSARQIIGDWVQALPTELIDEPMDAFGKRGWIPVTRVEACAGHVLRLAESLLRDGDLDERAANELRTFGGTIVPYPASTD